MVWEGWCREAPPYPDFGAVMTTLLLRALAAAAVLFLSSPAWGAEKAPVAPEQAARSGAAEAQTLIRHGKFDEALAILLPLVRGERVDADAVFLYGLAALGVSQKPGLAEKKREALLDEAIGAFHTMLVQRPELVRVRLELGRAFFLKGEDGLAREHFEQVLAGNPPAPVARNVNRFLAQIRARKRWTFRVGMALAPDSNIGAGSDERTIYIGGFPFRRDQQELTSSGIGLSAWAGGEYQFPLEERWRLRAGADVSRREYEKNEFDRMSVSAHLGPRWLIGRYSEASLLAVARRHWQANEPEHYALGFRTEARHRLSQRMVANARVSWLRRRYDERSHLDGPVTDVSFGGTYVMGPTIRTDAAMGWGRERPDAERFRHDRRWIQGGVSLALPLGFTVGARATLRWADYEGNWSFFTQSGQPRRDLTRSLRVNAFHRGFTIGGFSPQVSLVREARTSNAQLHDYERTFGELRFVRLF